MPSAPSVRLNSRAKRVITRCITRSISVPTEPSCSPWATRRDLHHLDPGRGARRGRARSGCPAAGPGSAGRLWHARGGILPSGPEELQSTPRASAARRERTGHASREPDVLASVRPGFRECRPRPSTSCGCAASRVASARPWPAASTPAAPRPRAFSPLPGQWSPAVLWVMILPSRRSRIAYPHDGQRPVFSVPISRGVPLPDGGANRSPGTAGGHEATGMPGHVVVSTTTRRPGLPLAGGCRPSQAGRKSRRA